jgi:HlyD family type I secretion membrane fusion protein
MNNTLTRGPLALLDGEPEPAGRAELKRLRRHALLPLLIAGLLLAAWSTSAPLAGAVVAPASVKVELNRKTVQHQEGGIVRELRVRDGQAVRAGDALMVVADLRSDADLAVLKDRWRATRVRIARAEAEARLADRFEPPAEIARDARAAVHLAREAAIFTTRRQALQEHGALLRTQAFEANAQAAGLQAQIDATGQSVRLSDEELALNDKLAAEGFVHRSRLIGLQRVSSDYRTRLAEHRSELALVRQRAGELQARVAQLRLQLQAQAVEELREANAALHELEQRLRPSQDHVERQTVRAPVDGTVMALRVAGPGAVVAPREPLLDVVPAREQLVIEARIAPQDIEHVRVGGAAEVRLLGSQARLLPPLPARVVFVAADRRTDERSGQSWFDVTVEVDAVAARQPDGPRLQPGLPAELYITTAERTLLQYLLQPLQLFSHRALREP